MSKSHDLEVHAGDTLSIPVSSDLITSTSPIGDGWSCLVAIKPFDSSTLSFAARAETTTNDEDTQFIVTLTSGETNQTPGVYEIVVQLRNDVQNYRKTAKVPVTILPALIA